MIRLRNCLVFLCLSALLPVSVFASTYILPQAAVGVAGDLRYITQISITNSWSEPSGVVVAFLTNTGDPWTVTTSCLENSDLNGSKWALNFGLPGQNKYAISMSSAGDIRAGWVAITSELPIAVSATYGLYDRLPGTIGKIPSDPLWEAAILPAPSAMELRFSAHSRAGDMIFGVDVNTGFAICNINDGVVTVAARVYDEDGTLLGTELFDIPRWGHVAQFIDELFNEIDLSDFRGVVKLTSSAPIAALAMKEGKRLDKAVYSTVPVVPTSDYLDGITWDRESNNGVNNAIPIEGRTQVYGTISGADNTGGVYFDYYRIQLTAGQRIEVVLLAGSLGSPLDPSLSLRDLADVQLASSGEIFFESRDRRLSYTAAATGPHFIRIGNYGGTDSAQSCYRMFVRVF